MLLHQGAVRFEGSIATFMAQSEGNDFQAEVLKQLGKGSI